jgi:hypothetical protein
VLLQEHRLEALERVRRLGGVRARAGTEVIVDLRARVDLMKPAKLSEEDL